MTKPLLKNITPHRLSDDQAQALLDKRHAAMAGSNDPLVANLVGDLDSLLADRAGLLAELKTFEAFKRIANTELNAAATLTPELAAPHYEAIRRAFEVMTKPVLASDTPHGENPLAGLEPAV